MPGKFVDKISETQLENVVFAEKVLNKYKGAMNKDVTGFGKSNQGFELACRQTLDTGRILYICAAGAAAQVLEDWNKEVQRKGKRRLLIEPYSQIINPHIFKTLMQGEYDFIIVDEAHRVKGLMKKKDTLNFFNLKTFSIAHAEDKDYVLQAYAVFALLTRCKNFFFMTATPIVGAITDIYPFLKAINHPLTKYGYYNYLDEWSAKKETTPFGTKWSGLRNKKAFAKALSDCIFGKKHSDEKDPKLRVPDPDEYFEDIPLPEELKLCDSYIEAKLGELGIDIASVSPKRLAKLLGEVPGFEALSRFREAQGFAKVPFILDYLVRLYKDPRSKGKIILFCYHKEVVRKYAEELKLLGIPYLAITGKVPTSKRLEFVKRANAMQKGVVLGTTAISENFNFNTYFHSLWAEYDWTKKTLNQQRGRNLRKGMAKASHHFPRFETGVERRIWELILEKSDIIEGAFGI